MGDDGFRLCCLCGTICMVGKIRGWVRRMCDVMETSTFGMRWRLFLSQLLCVSVQCKPVMDPACGCCNKQSICTNHGSTCQPIGSHAQMGPSLPNSVGHRVKESGFEKGFEKGNAWWPKNNAPLWHSSNTIHIVLRHFEWVDKLRQLWMEFWVNFISMLEKCEWKHLQIL